MFVEPHIECKWPALVVSGRPVTPDQAAEIIIRTAHWPRSSNHQELDQAFNEAAGFLPEFSWLLREGITREEREAIYHHNEENAARLGILDLQYLLNYRLTSTWIGGLHGWVDWDGTVGCSNYNIGKWPSVEDVTREWELIAKTFPFLNLRCQVYSGDTCDKDIEPTAEWLIRDGNVTLTSPNIPPMPVVEGMDYLFNDSKHTTTKLEDVKRGVELALKSQSQ